MNEPSPAKPARFSVFSDDEGRVTTIHISLSADLAHSIDALARRRRVSRSAAVRELIVDALASRQQPATA